LTCSSAGIDALPPYASCPDQRTQDAAARRAEDVIDLGFAIPICVSRRAVEKLIEAVRTRGTIRYSAEATAPKCAKAAHLSGAVE